MELAVSHHILSLMDVNFKQNWELNSLQFFPVLFSPTSVSLHSQFYVLYNSSLFSTKLQMLTAAVLREVWEGWRQLYAACTLLRYAIRCTHLLRWALVRWFLTKISNLISVAKVKSTRFSRSLNSRILGRQIEHPPSSPNLEDDQLGAQIFRRPNVFFSQGHHFGNLQSVKFGARNNFYGSKH